MKHCLLCLLLITGVAKVHVSKAQLHAGTNVEFNMFAGTAFKTSIINNGDTVVFDLSQATCVGQYLVVPISVISDDVINAVDFSMKYNNNKITYNSVLNYKPAYLTPSANFNTSDSILRFTSYSFVQPIDKNTAIAAVRFNLINGPILPTNFNTVKTYLNGDRCSFKFIEPVLPNAAITASGPTSFVIGDSVSLTANSGAGFSYLWSTSATTQTIKVYTAATYTVTVSNVGGCTSNAASVVTIMTPLPVTLLAFNVELAIKDIQVNWVTASESGNHFFTVERSSNGLTWKPIYSVNGTQNINTTTAYSFTDETPENGINYYRLKQTDFNGTIHFLASKAILSTTVNGNKELILAYVNPASGDLIVKAATNVSMQLFDTYGKVVLAPINLIANQETVLNTSFHAGGIYLLQAFSESGYETKKLCIPNY